MFHIQSNDGVKIAVYDPNPCGFETVLCIHGWPLSHKMFEYQEALLIRKGYRIVTIDLRGFGASDVPGCSYSYDQMAMDINIVIRSLNLHNITLVGFSMGGAIVLRYMRLFLGYQVKKLMLLAAAAPMFTQRPDYPYGVPLDEMDQLIELADTDRPQLARNFSRMLFATPKSEAALDWFEDISLSASGIGTVETGCSLRNEDGRNDLDFVCVPTAIFQADKDKIVPRDLTQLQYESIPNAKLYTFSNSGHGIVYDELEKFNRSFIDFLENY